MTGIKTISAIAILSAAIATPVLAQEAIPGPGSRYGLEPQPGPIYYRTYYQWSAPVYGAPRTSEDYWNMENYGFSGRDRSRPGGRSPWLNPPS